MNLGQFTQDGRFLMLALDHRQSIKKLVNPQNPDQVTDGEIVSLKAEIIDSLKDQFSGLLIDEVYGLSALDEAKNLRQSLTKPYLLPVEKSGYKSGNGERLTELEYNMAQLIEMGASGVKLLLYFNPAVESSKSQIETARKVLTDAHEHNLPLFLELVTYDVESNEKLDGQKIFDSVKMFLDAGIKADVFKLEYPGRGEECLKISNLLSETPWILLTGGENFDVFKSQLAEAVKNGCKGFLAGRALWQEVTQLSGDQKREFLDKTLPERFSALVKIAQGPI
ncbi:DUF2090 domain-containing protein [Candidatus Daviesbacteria bacterium]|nr:DUF2090 domain-containing protein [Candidatus Daviesbacteria bacterium]